MGHPTQVQRAGSGANDNDILFTVNDNDAIRECSEHFIRCTAGVIDIEVSVNRGANYSDSATFPIAVLLLNATDPNVFVTEIQAGQTALLLGHFDGIRARQKGATAAAGHISSNPR